MVRNYMLYPRTVFYENKKVHQPRWSEINAKNTDGFPTVLGSVGMAPKAPPAIRKSL